MILDWIQWPGATLDPLGPTHRRPHADSALLAQLAVRLLADRKFERVGICIGSERGSRNADRQFHDETIRKGPAFGSPSLFVYTLASAALGEAAIALGASGPVLSVSAGTCSGFNAILTAQRWLDEGLADAVIAGVAELPDHAALFLLTPGRGVSGRADFVASVQNSPANASVQPEPVEGASVQLEKQRTGDEPPLDKLGVNGSADPDWGELTAALANRTRLVLTATDPLGFQTTLEVTP